MGNKCSRAYDDETLDIGKNNKPSHNKKSKKNKGKSMEANIEELDNESSQLDEDSKQEDEAPEMLAEECVNLLVPGKKISLDDFKLLKVIGRGSFGKVYLVRKKDDGKPYAMKILRKDQLIKKNLLVKTQAERDILEKIKNPYIVGLHYAFQSETKLYFFIDFLNGGEMFTYLRKERQFSERRAKIYAAEMVDAIGCLHKNDIIYRDLKPENVLLDAEGHIRITDFGLSKQNVGKDDKTYSFCGTPEYLAPEIIKGTGHARGADWWSLGALLYEMLCGRPPHYNRNRQQMLRDIVEKPIAMRPYFQPDACDLLSKLLERNPEQRLGSLQDAEEIKAHPFFADVDWNEIATMSHETEFKPRVKGTEDTSCIDTLFTKEGLEQTHVDSNALTDAQKNAAHFPQFTYDQKGVLGPQDH